MPAPFFSKPAERYLTLLDIYKAVEGEKPLLDLDTHTNPDSALVLIFSCLSGIYDEIQKTAEGKMNTITLHDIINTYYQRTSCKIICKTLYDRRNRQETFCDNFGKLTPRVLLYHLLHTP